MCGWWPAVVSPASRFSGHSPSVALCWTSSPDAKRLQLKPPRLRMYYVFSDLVWGITCVEPALSEKAKAAQERSKAVVGSCSSRLRMPVPDDEEEED